MLSKGKKKLDKDKQERMDDLKSRLERHRFHIQKLEALLRMLVNESVEVKQVSLLIKVLMYLINVIYFQIKPIKDNVDYYIESWKEPDFEDNEFIYDDIIGLDEVELSGVGLPSSGIYFLAIITYASNLILSFYFFFVLPRWHPVTPSSHFCLFERFHLKI